MRPTSAQIVCGGCRTVLLYPASGAQNVRCARCSTITAVPPPVPAADMAQLCCSNAQCRVVLMYPRGAGAVQCSVCGNISDASQANQLGHVVCGGCQVTLAHAYGAQSVKCAGERGVWLERRPRLPSLSAPLPRAPTPSRLRMPSAVCNFVTPVTALAHAGTTPTAQHAQQPIEQQQPQGQPQQQPQGQPQQQAQATVLVENPATQDAQGNEVQNVVLGVGGTKTD